MVHLLFEQRGTFKRQFKELGFEAVDYDIQNEFGETDNVIDLFHEIEEAYEHRPSIFDKITPEDLIMAFFPCVRFEVQIIMAFKGTQYQMRNQSDERKLEYDLKLHKELSKMYELVTKLAIVCLRNKLPLIIENPYSTQHYLTRYWALEPAWIDHDRTMRGDFYEKPTQYWFINCEPKHNFVMEPQVYIEHTKDVAGEPNHTQRSMISSDYARKFIKEFIC